MNQSTMPIPDQTGVLSATPDDAAQVRQDATQPLEAPAPSMVYKPQTETWEAAKAGWNRWTHTNQALMAAAVVNGIDASDIDDPTYNQYAYAAQHKTEYADVWENVLAGHFDEVRSEAGFKRRAHMIRENKLLDEEIANAGLGGQLAGMGLSLFDVTTLISGAAFVRAARGASLLSTAYRGAKVGAVEGAISEVAMQNLDPTQTWKDAVVNIGFSSLAGGALGGLYHYVTPSSKLGLEPENIGRHEEVIERGPSGSRDEELKLSNEPPEFGDAGAAAVRPGTRAAYAQYTDTDTEIALGGRLSQLVDTVFSKLLIGSPLGRMKYMPPVLRGYLTQAIDQQGLLNRGMARGQAAAPEAESLRANYLHKGRALQEELGGILRKTQVSMGDSAVSARLKGALDTMSHGKLQNSTLKREDFFNEVFEDMSAYMTKDLEAANKATARLKAAGYADDQIALIQAGVKEASTKARAHMDAMAREAVDTGLMDPKLLQENYGLPVMYVRSAINARPDEFEATMMSLLRGQPPEEELKKLGLVWDAVEADPAKGIEAKPARTFKEVQEDPVLWNQALKEWAGERESLEREIANQKWSDAETQLNRVMAEVEAMTEGLDLLNKDKKVKTVGAARTAARLAEAQWHERNLGTSLARVDRAEAKVAKIERDYPELFGLRDDAARQKVADGNTLDDAAGAAQRAADDVADGTHLSDFLKGERSKQHAERSGADTATWQGKRDKLLAQEEIDRLNAEMRQARTELQEAQLNLAEARGVMKATSRNQRNADRWVAATEAKAKEFAKHADEAKLGDGFREQLDIERDRIDQLKAKVQKAQDLRAQAIETWKLGRKGLGVSRKELRAAKREHAKTGRIAKMTGDRMPIAKYVEELRMALSGMGKAPAGMLLDEVPESGRLQERKFKHTSESWAALKAAGFVESDVSHLMDRYTKDMGGRLAWHKAYGGEPFPSLVRKADEDGNRWIAEAKDPKERERRQTLKDKGLKDLEMMRDRTLGKYDIQDTDPISWGVKAIQNGAYLRIAGGIAWSAMQDIGTAMFSTPKFLRGLMTGANQYKRLVREYEEALAKGDPEGKAEGLRQMTLLMTSMENVAFTGVSSRAVGGGSALEQIGVGYGITRTMTRNIEVAMNNIADKTTWLTGLNFISDYTRRTAAFVQMANLRHWVKNMDSISASHRAQLASLGVGEPEAKRLRELFDKYGRTHGKLFDPGLDRWMLEPDGARWKETFEILMTKAQRRASYTESFGSTPPMLMDNHVAKLLFQFMSHAIMTTNNFMRAGVQRGAVTGDYLSGTAALGTSVALGTAVASLRGFVNGKDKMQEWEENPSKLAREVFDRSNLLGAASPYFDAGSKLFGGHINKLVGGKFFEAGTKFSQNSWYESLLGPWLGQIRAVGGSVTDVVNGDLDASGKKLARLIPLNQQIRLLQELAKSIAD